MRRVVLLLCTVVLLMGAAVVDRRAGEVAAQGQRPAGTTFSGKAFRFNKVKEGVYHAIGTGALAVVGNSTVLVYPSEYAGTNQATGASWSVGEDFDSIVEALRAKGITFERYDDLPDTTREGDVHVTDDDFKAVWFKDQNGNILNLVNATM